MEASRSFPQAAQLLLSAGADPNVKDRDGNTALKYAISTPKLFARMLEKGADPSLKNKQGGTIKEEIIRQNATEIAKLLRIPLEEQLVMPPDDEVEKLFIQLRAGIDRERAEELFGKPTSLGMDEENGTEYWEYRLPNDLRLFINWNGIGDVWYYEIESKGADDILYRYIFSPGDEKVVAS
jgi:hypothetical protein